MDETEITKFDFTVAQLNEIVAETKDIVVVDLENVEEIKKVKEARKRLGTLRVDIKKFGKSKRDWFNSMSAKIITREKELVAIVEKEEDRLYAFEEEVAKKQLLADRIAVLPQRKFQLSNIKDGIEVTDEFLCSMNAEQFMGYANKRVADKNEKTRLELEAREEELHKEENELKQKEEIRLAEEKVREEERIKAEKKEQDRIKDEELKAERERQRVAQEKLDKEQKEKTEAEEMIRNEKYQNWLTANGYTEELKSDFIIEKVGNKVRLSKIIGIYTYENNA